MQSARKKREITPEEIKKVRSSFGLTQEEFAKKLGVSKLTVARWETSERSCKGVAAQKIRELQDERLLTLIPTTSILDISFEDLTRLDPPSSIEFFRELLVCETRKVNAPPTSIEISPEEIADGGIDCRLRFPDKMPAWASNNHTIYFQVKSGKSCEPWKKGWIKKELFKQKTPKFENLGKEVARCLNENGCYIIVFFGIHLIPNRISEAINLFREFFSVCGFPNANIEVWGQTQLISMISQYPSLALKLNGGFDLEFQEVGSWHANHDMSLEYFEDPNQNTVINDIRNALLSEDIAHIKLTGEPGIGKTRLALEAIKKEEFAPYAVYVSSAEKFIDSKLYNQLLRTDNAYNLILILDTCPPQISRSIWNTFKNRNRRCKLLSIENEKYKSSDLHELVIECPILSDNTVEKIIESYTGQKSDTKRWRDICSGSPSYAHLLGYNLLNNPSKILDPLSHKDIVENAILRGQVSSNQQIENTIIVLRHLALFNKFGFGGAFKNEVGEIYKLIENSTASLRAGDIQAIIKKLQKQGLIKGTETLFISPKALQIKLWVDCWEYHGHSLSIQKILTGNLSDRMKEWFFEMICYAHASPSAVHQIREFLRPGSDHFNADFFFTKMSAWMFNELAEAEPSAVLGALKGIFENWDQKQFSNFRTGRQDIVFALEKIALYPKFFNDSARMLLKLAESDNNFHSNNAMGTFVGLFSLAPGLVAPTGAFPLDRLELLKEILNSTSSAIFEIALKGFQKSLSHPIHSGLRIIGPEYQGLRETVTLWTPNCEDEFHTAYKTYWKALADSRDYLDMSKRKRINMVLIDSAEYLLYFDWMNELIIEALYSLLEDDTTDFKQLVDMISSTIKYREHKLPSSTIMHLKKIDELLTGKSISQKVKRFALYSNHNDFSGNDGHDNSILREIACECFEKLNEFIDLIPILVKGHNQAIIQFGYEVGKLDSNKIVFNTIKNNYEASIQESTYMFIGGYLKAVFESNIMEWEAIVLELIQNANYEKSIGSIIRESGLTDKVIEGMLSCYDNKHISIIPIFNLFHSNKVKNLKTSNILAIVQRLRDCQRYENAIDLIYFVCCDKKTKHVFPESFVINLFRDYSRSNKHSDIADYGFSKILDLAITNNPNRNEEVFECFVNRIFNKNDLMSFTNPLYEIIQKIIKSSPGKCWKILSAKLDASDELLAWRFTLWLNSSPIKLSYFSEELILAWIAESPAKRAELIAKMTLKTLDHSDDGKLGRELLDRYGDQEKIQAAMIANFFSGSWSGKESDYFQSKIEIAHGWFLKETSKRIKDFIEKYIEILSHHITRSKTQEEREYC